MSEDIDINIQYEQIFGHEERPNIFKPDDEEYKALRQEILASKHSVVKSNELPFTGVNIIPYDEYIRNSIIQLSERKGYHIFYLKVYKNTNLDIYAAGYYDERDDKFVVLQNSFCNDSEYFYELSQKQKEIHSQPSKSISDSYTRAIAFINSFAIKGSKMVQNKAVSYDSASLAASYFLGHKTTFRAWKDAAGQSLDNFYNKYKTSNIDASEDRTFPGYNPFYIKRDAQSTRTCFAFGNYDEVTEKFTLKAGSLIALVAVPSYDVSSAGMSRARSIVRYCAKEQNGYRLKRDLVFHSPSAAASYVLGRMANGWLDWINDDGNTLGSAFRKK